MMNAIHQNIGHWRRHDVNENLASRALCVANIVSLL